MIRAIFQIFLIIQIVFTLVDLIALRQESRLSARAFFRQNSGTLYFIIGFWVLFFLVQSAGILALPGFGSLKQWMASMAHIDIHAEVGSSPRTWAGVFVLNVWMFLLVSFWDYVTHRYILHHPRAWGFHEYHHIPRMVFNGMPGISVRPFAVVATLLSYLGVIPFLLLPLRYGVSREVGIGFINILPVTLGMLTLILSVVHSYFLTRQNWAHRCLKFFLITTPQEHLLHHSRHRAVNFGNFSTIWDRFFGSYLDPKKVDLKNEPLGVDYPSDFLSTLTFGQLRLPAAYTKALGLERLFKPFDHRE